MSSPINQMSKGETRPLNFTKESPRWRIVAGLGWDPKESVSLLDKAKALTSGKAMHHDLDLSCYIYDKEKRYISHVTAEAERHVDQTGQIYHSGDNVQGVGDGDDEQISVELKDLDQAIHSIVFKASIKTGHTFKEVNTPEIRLADGYSDRNFLHCDLSDEGSSSFVFVCISRGDSPEEWTIKYVDEFINDDGQDWPAYLKQYL